VKGLPYCCRSSRWRSLCKSCQVRQLECPCCTCVTGGPLRGPFPFHRPRPSFPRPYFDVSLAQALLVSSATPYPTSSSYTTSARCLCEEHDGVEKISTEVAQARHNRAALPFRQGRSNSVQFTRNNHVSHLVLPSLWIACHHAVNARAE
jgi:hypothetical protein